MYTSGIRKIFTPQTAIPTLEATCAVATTAGYSALAFNGQIFIKTDTDEWEKTPFRISDLYVSY